MCYICYRYHYNDGSFENVVGGGRHVVIHDLAPTTHSPM